MLLHLGVCFPRKYNSTPPVYSHFTFPWEIIAFTVRPVCIHGFPGLLDPSTAEIMCFKLYVGVIGVGAQVSVVTSSSLVPPHHVGVAKHGQTGYVGVGCCRPTRSYFSSSFTWEFHLSTACVFGLCYDAAV